jgi:hypothetical protein
MEMTLTNRAMQPMTGFAIQFNKNSFGLVPAAPLTLNAPLLPNQSQEVSMPLNAGAGPVMKMDPINNLQVRSSLLVKYWYSSVFLFHKI